MTDMIGQPVKVALHKGRLPALGVFLGWGMGYKNNRDTGNVGQFTVGIVQVDGNVMTVLPSDMVFPFFHLSSAPQENTQSEADEESYPLHEACAITPEDMAFMMGWKGQFDEALRVQWPMLTDKAMDFVHQGLAARTVWDVASPDIRVEGKCVVHCPYVEGSADACAWYHGFIDADAIPTHHEDQVLEGMKARNAIEVVYAKP